MIRPSFAGRCSTHSARAQHAGPQRESYRAGRPVADAPIKWSYSHTPDDTTVAPGGPGIIDDGLFAANAPGVFEIIAQSGNVSARTALSVAPRDARRRINIVGRGAITNQHTSDLWPWSGQNGRDYVFVGTWGSDGYALVFDITDLITR